MAIDSSSPIQAAVSQELCAELLKKAENGTLSLTEELLGYTLGATLVAQEYSRKPAPPVELPQRRIAAPELLKGRLRKGVA